jgi:protein-S-isoprenylcysteine O-methyltransferase Ste14
MRNMPARDQERARAAAQPSAAQPDPAADRPGSSARQIGLERLVRLAANVAGAAAAVFFARASLQFYLQTHQLIGGAFFIEQTWFVIAFLIRRPPKAVSRGLGGWVLAYGGTFGGTLLRPVGAHPPWGVNAGLGLQLLGLAICGLSFAALGRSLGLAPANRGLVTRGPYAVVRHPLYAAYVLIQLGYLLQSMALWNVLVMVLACGCNIGRVLTEERLLGTSAAYAAYRQRVRWRLLPGVW